MSSSIHTIHRSVESPRAPTFPASSGIPGGPHRIANTSHQSDYFLTGNGSGKHHHHHLHNRPPSVVHEELPSPSDISADDEEADFEQSPDEMESDVENDNDGETILEGKGKGKKGGAAGHIIGGDAPLTASPGIMGSTAIPSKAARSGTLNTVTPASLILANTTPGATKGPLTVPQRMGNPRSMSVATVRLKRRTKLAVKLREVFEIDSITEVVAGMFLFLLFSVHRIVLRYGPCWPTWGSQSRTPDFTFLIAFSMFEYKLTTRFLLPTIYSCLRRAPVLAVAINLYVLSHFLERFTSCSTLDQKWMTLLFMVIVLQGYMYLTNSHICFFAHMPSREVCLPAFDAGPMVELGLPGSML